jgi:hypothetical protein
MGAGMVVGIFGYVTERRKRGASGVRRFLLWYLVAVVFMACMLCSIT